MGLSFFNQRRAREVQKAKVLEVQPVVEEIVEETIEEENEVQPVEETPKPKKTDAEKIKKKR